MAKRVQPWHKVLPPREDLREGRPLDASEFAVHLDDVRKGGAPSAYRVPEEFFSRTYMTDGLTDLGAQVVRRLSGIAVSTSAVFQLATQFGGGKTHALTMLYHLAETGSTADKWAGVSKILERAEISSVPSAATAVFVGTEFDPLAGRGGGNEPLRLTPWGEIGWQLGGEESFAYVKEHDQKGIEPKGDVIRQMLPAGPCLILMDEILNYVSTYRQIGKGDRFYAFLQSLTEVVRGRENVSLVVSIPASELEYSPSDQAEEARLKKLLDRVGKPLMMSADIETAEIVRRRLFDWEGLPQEAYAAADAYVDWLRPHRQLTGASDLSTERERFLGSYPFHPSVLSVFERKWQSLPRFQRTRGVLRLLALWVSNAYATAYQDNRLDAVIGVGSAPLDEPYFRAAVFEQLGTNELEGAVTTDIAGSGSSHAIRLDGEADTEIRRHALHRRVLTTIFFESNGGQTRTEATLAEVRYAAGEPGLDIANIETVLDALRGTCFYLKSRQTGYWFSTTPNLNLVLVSARARVDEPLIRDRARREIERMFRAGDPRVERALFPRSGADIPDRAALIVVALGIERNYGDVETEEFVRTLLADARGPRVYKGSLIVCVCDAVSEVLDEIRQLLALEDTADDKETVNALEASDQRLLEVELSKATESVREGLWQSYRHLYLVGDGGKLLHIDLGRIGSGNNETKVDSILRRLIEDDRVTESVGVAKLIRSWPVDSKFWPTATLRDAFFSSPRLPRLIDPSDLKRTIARGVTDGELGYASKASDGELENVLVGDALSEYDIEFKPNEGILKPEDARRLQQPAKLTSIRIQPVSSRLRVSESLTFLAEPLDQHGRPIEGIQVRWSASGGTVDAETGRFESDAAGAFSVQASADGVSESVTVLVRATESEQDAASHAESLLEPVATESSISWRGAVPPQALNNFYMRVLAVLAGYDLKLEVSVSLTPPEGSEEVLVDQMKAALRGLGLDTESLDWTK